MFGKGINDGLLSDVNSSDYVSFFSGVDTIKQLEEAFVHSTRAFYDCADYILLTIKQDVDESKKNNIHGFLNLRNQLVENDAYISELRSAKSESMEKTLENINKWDSFLQLITSAYIFKDYDVELREITAKIRLLVNSIEKQFEDSVIKNHDPNFYQNKQFIAELESLAKNFEKRFAKNGELLKDILENPQNWCDDIIDELKEKIQKAHEYESSLETLQSIMKNTGTITKRKSFIKTIIGFASTIVSWVITHFLSSKTLVQQTISTNDEVVSTRVDSLNIGSLLIFLVISFCVFLIGIGIYELILKLKNSRK